MLVAVFTPACDTCGLDIQPFCATQEAACHYDTTVWLYRPTTFLPYRYKSDVAMSFCEPRS